MTAPPVTSTTTDQARIWLAFLDERPALIAKATLYFDLDGIPSATIRCAPETEAATLSGLPAPTSTYNADMPPILRQHYFTIAGMFVTLSVWADAEVCQHCGNPVHQ